MYMANAKNLRLGPNATYIQLTRVGVSPNAKDTNMLVYFVFGTQKYPTRMVYASQWNIGFIPPVGFGLLLTSLGPISET